MCSAGSSAFPSGPALLLSEEQQLNSVTPKGFYIFETEILLLASLYILSSVVINNSYHSQMVHVVGGKHSKEYTEGNVFTNQILSTVRNCDT